MESKFIHQATGGFSSFALITTPSGITSSYITSSSHASYDGRLILICRSWRSECCDVC
jgi:hypothetical protein